MRCTAPSGAQITAIIGDEQYEMTQLEPDIAPGYPAIFRAEVPLPDNIFEVTNLGHVSYSMVYNDRVSYYTSQGELFLLAEQQELVIRVTDPLAPVYSGEDAAEILYTLPQGTKDYVVKNTEDYFYLESGGCIRKSAAEVLTKATDIYTLSKKISNVVVQSTSRGEYITFAGGSELPCGVSYDPENRTVTLHLSHVLDIPLQLDYLQSDLFEDIQVTRSNSTVTLTLTLREGMPFYGYQVTFNEENMVVYFRSHFAGEDAQSPLDGVSIVIDPGHGGSDTGLLGLLGENGPDEETLDLALANALYDRLHALGANVYLTRSSHTAMAGLDRVMFSQYREADLFISIHHCTSDEPGIYVSYNNAFSGELARRISDGLSARLQRPQQDIALTSSYVGAVTLMPAISIEGFEEATDSRRGNGTYEKIIRAMNILKERKLPFGISCCYTSANAEIIGSEEYFDQMIEMGAKFAWFFTYMPVGKDAVKELMATAEQREMMYHKIREYRKTKPIFTVDFWNDGEYVGGCIAGGRCYCHINANGDIEPCAFIHYSDSNIREKSLIEAYQSPLFMGYHDNQPWNDNMLRPCPVLDNPGRLTEIVEKSHAKSTDYQNLESAKEFTDKCVETAEKWAPVADRLWEESHGGCVSCGKCQKAVNE